MSGSTTEATVGRRRRSALAVVLGVAVSAVLLGLVMQRVDPVATWRQLRGLDARWLAPAGLAGLISLGFRAGRWGATFPATARPGLWASFRGLGLGNLLNLVLPARAGDVVRCLLSRRGHPDSHPSTALGAMVLEKLLDGLAALAVLALAAAVLDRPVPGWFRGLCLSAAAIFAAALGGLVLLRLRPEVVLYTLRTLAHRVRRESLGDRLAHLAARFLRGLEPLGSPARAAGLAGLTAAVWACEAVAVACLAAAVGVPLGTGGAIVTTAVIALATMIPSAPGYIGTYEFFAVGALGLFGIAESPAMALAVVMHAYVYVLIALVGLACWAWEWWAWGAVGAQVETGPGRATPTPADGESIPRMATGEVIA